MNANPFKHATKTAAYRCLPADSAFRVYIRIMEADANDRGVRLTADEVAAVANDDAVYAAAQNALGE